MSILKYIQESLVNEVELNETQKEAKAIASKEGNSFTMDDLSLLKSELSDPKLFKYLGWIARNWDSYDGNNLIDSIKYYNKRVGSKNSNLLPIDKYKSIPELVKATETDNNSIKALSSISNKPSSDRYNVIWESEDKKIRVIVPHTKTASIKQGRGTKWCTSANTSPGMDYDSEHMFCNYVYGDNQIMIYIINDNLEKTDPFHKTAIRVEFDKNGVPNIGEIRDMNNSRDYSSTNNEMGWNDTYNKYLNDYDIPLQEILKNKASGESKALDSDRKKYTEIDRMEAYIVDNDIDGIDSMVQDGYIPSSYELNTALSYDNIDLAKILYDKYNTVKVDDNTLAASLEGSVSQEQYDFISQINLPKSSYRNVNIVSALLLLDPKDFYKSSLLSDMGKLKQSDTDMLRLVMFADSRSHDPISVFDKYREYTGHFDVSSNDFKTIVGTDRVSEQTIRYILHHSSDKEALVDKDVIFSALNSWRSSGLITELLRLNPNVIDAELLATALSTLPSGEYDAQMNAILDYAPGLTARDAEHMPDQDFKGVRWSKDILDRVKSLVHDRQKIPLKKRKVRRKQ